MHVFYVGNSLEVLKHLASDSVHCCVTSPPYWSLRDYGADGQLGLETTPEEYLEKLVDVFREVHQVLRPEGTLWLNMGDCYAHSTKGTGGGWANDPHNYANKAQKYGARKVIHGLKPKDLVGIPWRVAFALQADGWYLRSDIIWHKRNCMPESVKDRPTKSHEYIFLLTKSPRYFYDAEAIKEPLAKNSDVAYRNQLRKGKKYNAKDPYQQNFPANFDITGKNRRSVWTIPTVPFKGAHFAVFPPKLAELCILAGTSPMACQICGAPWERVVRKETKAFNGNWQEEAKKRGGPVDNYVNHQSGGNTGFKTGSRKILGEYWQPTCSCPENNGSGKCVVLDPFGGAGTVAVVAEQLGRDSIYIDIKPEYAEMDVDRLTKSSTEKHVEYIIRRSAAYV